MKILLLWRKHHCTGSVRTLGVHENINAGAGIEIKMGQGAKPGIGGHLPGTKIVGDVSRTRNDP